jgi:hypothetical protein
MGYTEGETASERKRETERLGRIKQIRFDKRGNRREKERRKRASSWYVIDQRGL